MATVTGLTASRMLQIEGQSIVDARLENYDLILTTFGGQDINVGDIRGAQGIQGETGETGFYPVILSVATDFDTLTAPGTYLFTSSAAVGSSANKPDYPGVGALAGYLIVHGNGTTFIKQEWTNYNNTSEQLSRSKYNSTWYTWRPNQEVATTSQDGLMSKAHYDLLAGATANATLDTLVRRSNSSNNFLVDDPTATKHVTTKSYVDGRTAAATLTTTGVVELATTAETQAGGDSTRAVTPAGLASVVATATAKGLVELATDAEAQAGTDTSRAVTPANLASLAGYRLLDTAIYTSSGTFSKASYPGLKAVRIRAVGGGGGGGGSNAATANNHSIAGGGGGGGYAETFVLAASLAASETLTVGAGGAAGSSGTGGTGGTSSFGTHAVATGGLGGSIVTNTALYLSAPGGAGGAGTTGTLKIGGNPGELGTGYATLGIGGTGGASMMGPGGMAQYNASSAPIAGLPGGLYGGGGSGSSANQNSVNGGSQLDGGAGAKGVIIVEVYV